MGDQNLDTKSELSPSEKYCKVGDQCYLKTFKGYPVDHECYIQSIPVGFRFKPTDAELISHHLTNKIIGKPLDPNYIQQVNIRDYAPAELTDMYKEYAVDGSEWYFFTKRERKYPNGNRPKRDAGGRGGYWKATGTTQAIKDENEREIGSKRTLVYYKWDDKELRIKGNETKTDYKMHEYVASAPAKSAEDPDTADIEHSIDQGSKVKAFTDFALCKIYLNPPRTTGNSEPVYTPANSDDNSEEEFVDPFPYFGTGLSPSEENELFERELIEENQTNEYFNNLPDTDPTHPDFYDFDGQEILTDEQLPFMSCNRTHCPVPTPQKSRQRRHQRK
ncbi:NAC domain-containing protein 72-like [Papaver somniferum]|uniref:NAC domain-containing protein 72-like n=1 Tax=Papaver somniferum TaxID=3469 RepID=UPI000E6F6F06|nr:NAC domain-containing protein 72-like [Papaver somniferum]